MSPLNHLPVPTDRAMRVGKYVVIVAVLAFALWALLSFARLGRTAEDNVKALDTARAERAELDRRADALEKDVDKRDSAVRTANKRLRKAGEPPVTIPQQPVSVPKVDGQPVLTSDDVLTLIEAEVKAQHPDLTQAQRESITQAAAVQAAERIPEPKDGADGPTVADLEPIIRAEVAKIPTPADGTDGKDGTNGTDGRTPSAEEVAAALATLCGGSCKGEAGTDGTDGTDGKDGQDGQDGRGITSITCEADGSWLVTYTDGTTSTATGPCRVTPPEPSPSPTSTEPSPTTTGATP